MASPRPKRREGQFGGWINDSPLPLNLSDILNGYASVFTPLETVAHLRMLLLAWHGDEAGTGSIPADDRTLALVARVSRATWKKIRDRALTGFIEDQFDTLVCPDLITASAKQKDAKRRALSLRLRFSILERDKFRCQYCGRGQADDTTLVVDHIHPVAAGGTDDPDNLTTACFECNAGKSDRLILQPTVKGVQ